MALQRCYLVIFVVSITVGVGLGLDSKTITLRGVLDINQVHASSIKSLNDTLNDPDKLNELYSKYQGTFGKFGAEAENSKRKQIFKSNLLKIAKHNEQFKSGKVTYSMGVNQFTDMTYSEVINKYTGYKRGVPVNNVTRLTSNSRYKISSVPNAVDWRDYGLVTPVKSQAQCGSCVLFAATACLESYYALTHYGQSNSQVDLSEEELLCCDNGPNYPGNGGCGGNTYQPTFKYLKDIGLSLEKDYPYDAKQGNCQASGKNHVAKVKNYWSVGKDENSLKEAIGKFGPVAVAIHVSDSFANFGGSGVYSGPCDGGINHAVLAVGYGNQNGQDYWLLKNSWDTWWGDKGYIKIARNKGNLCSVASDAIVCSDVAIAIA